MATEAIHLFDPRKTMQLQGFSGRAATTTITSASETGFTVSGIFQAPDDFAVLEWHNCFDFYNHLRCKPLPRADLSGIVLQFDIAADHTLDGNVRLGSKKYPSVAWDSMLFYFGPTLDLWMVKLSSYASVLSGALTDSTASVLIGGSGTTGVLEMYFRDGHYRVDASDAGFSGAPTVSLLASALASLINTGTGTGGTIFGSDYGGAGFGYIGAVANGSGAGSLTVTFSGWGKDGNQDRLFTGDSAHYIGGTPFGGFSWTTPVSGNAYGVRFSGGDDTRVYRVVLPLSTIQGSQTPGGPLSVLASVSTGAGMTDVREMTMTFAPRFENIEQGFENGAFLTAGVGASSAGTVENWTVDDSSYLVVNNKYYVGTSSLEEVVEVLAIASTSSIAVQRGIDSSTPWAWTSGTRMKSVSALTGFTPDVEWSVAVSNIVLSGSSASLQVGGPNENERLEETVNAAYTGSWDDAPLDWWSGGHAKRTAPASGVDVRNVSVHYQKNATHDLYIGTKYAANCGILSVRVDGDTATTHDLYMNVTNEVPAMLKLRSGLSSGAHTVVLTATYAKNAASAGYYFYYDYCWPLVPGDVPDAPWTRANASLAIDFDTDHGIKKPPYWLVWQLKKLGFMGWADVYMGVYWNNKRRRVSQTYPNCTIAFATIVEFTSVQIDVGGTTVTLVAGYGSTAEMVCSQFRTMFNAMFPGIWCDDNYGTSTTLSVRSSAPSFTFTPMTATATGGSSVTLTQGTPAMNAAGAAGDWQLLDSIVPVMTQGARDWFLDLASQFVAAGIQASWAFSMECYLPPAAMRAKYPLSSSGAPAPGADVVLPNTPPDYQMHFGTQVQNYLGEMYKEAADQVAAAGMVPVMQFGETQWWYFPDSNGMPYYDAFTIADFLAAYGHAMWAFLTNNDDPAGDPSHPYETASFLKQRIWNYCSRVIGIVQAAHPEAFFEVLWPRDANQGNGLPGTSGYRQLNQYVNLPDQWKVSSGGIKYFRTEGYDYDVVQHSISLAMVTALYPYSALGRPASECRFLQGIFASGGSPDVPLSAEFWAWQNSLLSASGSLALWAFDQFCLYSRPVPIPQPLAGQARFTKAAVRPRTGLTYAQVSVVPVSASKPNRLRLNSRKLNDNS